MARSKQVVKKKEDRFLFIKTLTCITNLLACLVWMIGGIKAGVRTGAIVYHCLLTVAVVGIIAWVITRVMGSYEEINSGKT